MLNYLKTMLGFSLLVLIGVWIGCSSNTSPVASYSASKSHTAGDADAGTIDPTVEPPAPTDSEDGGLTDTGNDPVTIPDENLKHAIRIALGRPSSDLTSAITQTDLASLRRLDANHLGIVNLAGLEHAVNLDTLNLYRNGFTDITPLAELTNLKVLNMYRGSIEDISPLAELTNLKRLAIGAQDFGGDLSPLAGLENLEWLKVNDAAVRDLSPLENLKKLNNLNLSSNAAISDYSPLKCLLPTLKILQLRGMHGDTVKRYIESAAGLKIVDGTRFPALEYLGKNLTIIWD